MVKEPKSFDITNSIMRAVGSTTSLVVHTLAFVAIFSLRWFGYHTDQILLILTTAVSLEAIYLSLFIQIAVNRNTQSLEEVEEDVAEIAEDVQEIEKDVDEIQKDVDEIEKDVDEIQEDVEGIEKDVDVIQKDVDEIQEDVEEIAEEETAVPAEVGSLENVEVQLKKLLGEIEALKKKQLVATSDKRQQTSHGK